MPDELEDYRKYIAEAEQKAQEDFDKTIIALSGGGLAISFTFVDKFIKVGAPHNVPMLFYSWMMWAASLLFVFASYFCSIRALRRTLKQSYEGSVYVQRPGGKWAIATEFLNIAGAILFAIGLLLIILFIRRNLPGL
jgi:hypothetical protein